MDNNPTDSETIAQLKLELSVSEAQREKTESLYTTLSDKYRLLFDAHKLLLNSFHEMPQVPRKD